MTDLEIFSQRAGRAARKVRDDDLATGREPVWMTPEQAWAEFSEAVLRAPTTEQRDLFIQAFLTDVTEEV